MYVYEDDGEEINSYYKGRADFNSISTTVPIGSNITVKMRKPGLLQFTQCLKIHDDTSMSVINTKDNYFDAGQLLSAAFSHSTKIITINNAKIIDLYLP